MEYELTDRRDQLKGLDLRQKFQRSEYSVYRVTPAQQGLGFTGKPLCSFAAFDFRLVLHQELAVQDGLFQLTLRNP